MSEAHLVDSLEALEALYKPVNPNSLAKETSVLTSAYRRWLTRARFFAIATSGPGGLDCSPRGDPQEQLVRILGDGEIAIPDRRGNNRLDTLRNLVLDPRVSLLFLTPGVNECLRINGRAQITTDPDLLTQFEMRGKLPASVILVAIEAVYFQCARALARAQLWDPTIQVDPKDLPSAGQMAKSALPDFDAEAYDAALPARHKETLY